MNHDLNFTLSLSILALVVRLVLYLRSHFFFPDIDFHIVPNSTQSPTVLCYLCLSPLFLFSKLDASELVFFVL